MAQLALLGLAVGASFFFATSSGNDTAEVEVGGHTFRVLKDTPERMNEVARQLAALRGALQSFVASHAAPGTQGQQSEPTVIERVAARWNGGLRETGKGAYTVDKAVISMCVRHPRTGAMQSWDTCMFVALHELAHVGTERLGHTELFWRNFAAMVRLAVDDKILDPQSIGGCYCGEAVGAIPT